MAIKSSVQIQMTEKEARRRIVEINEILNSSQFKINDKTKRELEEKLIKLHKIAY